MAIEKRLVSSNHNLVSAHTTGAVANVTANFPNAVAAGSLVVATCFYYHNANANTPSVAYSGSGGGTFQLDVKYSYGGASYCSSHSLANAAGDLGTLTLASGINTYHTIIASEWTGVANANYAECANFEFEASNANHNGATNSATSGADLVILGHKGATLGYSRNAVAPANIVKDHITTYQDGCQFYLIQGSGGTATIEFTCSTAEISQLTVVAFKPAAAPPAANVAPLAMYNRRQRIN